jgi:signal peptidase I
VSRLKELRANPIVDGIITIASAILIAYVVQLLIVKPYRIPSESMVPTLEVNQRVLVDRVSFRFSDPERGDIVVFKPPHGADLNTCGVEHPDNQPCPEETPEKSDTNFIKRVVGEPGDRLSVRGGRVYIDGELQDDDAARPAKTCATCNLEKPITIPPDHYFMMGDNRGESADSREWGPVPKKWIIGRAFATYWPPKKIGTL